MLRATRTLNIAIEASRQEGSDKYNRKSTSSTLTMEEVLEGALSSDNTIRRQAEERLCQAAGQRGFAAALATKLAAMNQAFHQWDAHRLMAGAVLLRFVRECWAQQAGHLSAEEKAQVWRWP